MDVKCYWHTTVLLMEAAFWYNMSLQSGQAKESMTHRVIFKDEWQHLNKLLGCSVEERGPVLVEVGDEAWFKLPNTCNTTQWNKGIATTVNSKDNISVGGMS